MKKNIINMNIRYSVANTQDSINDAIAREIHEIETLKGAAKKSQIQLIAFIKENFDAIDASEVERTLKANGYSKQAVSDLLLEYGVRRRAKSKIREEKGEKIEAKFNEAKTALMKLCGNDRKLFRAVITRLYQKAK